MASNVLSIWKHQWAHVRLPFSESQIHGKANSWSLISRCWTAWLRNSKHNGESSFYKQPKSTGIYPAAMTTKEPCCRRCQPDIRKEFETKSPKLRNENTARSAHPHRESLAPRVHGFYNSSSGTYSGIEHNTGRPSNCQKTNVSSAPSLRVICTHWWLSDQAASAASFHPSTPHSLTPRPRPFLSFTGLTGVCFKKRK